MLIYVLFIVILLAYLIIGEIRGVNIGYPFMIHSLILMSLFIYVVFFLAYLSYRTIKEYRAKRQVLKYNIIK